MKKIIKIEVKEDSLENNKQQVLLIKSATFDAYVMEVANPMIKKLEEALDRIKKYLIDIPDFSKE